MRLCDIFKKENIFVNISAANKFELISNMVELMQIDDKKIITGSIISRENTRSTDVGCDLAFPHCYYDKLDTIHGSVSVINPPIDWQPNKPVKIAIMLFGPKSMSATYILTLAKLVKKFGQSEIRDKITNSNVDEIFQIIENSDI